MPSNDTTIRFNADITDLKASMQEAGRLARLANSEFKNASAGLGKWSDSADGLKAKITQLTKQEQIQKRVLEALQNEYKQVAQAEGEDSKGAQELKIKLNEQSAAVKKTQSDIAHYSDSLDKLENEADQAATDIQKTGKAAKQSSDGFTVMKGALSSLVADGIRLAARELKQLGREIFEVGSNFESAMSKVQAVSGADSTQMEQLTAKAKEMGESTVFSATESAEAFNYMAMAGWKTEDMLGGIGGVMNLAAASGEDLATTSDIVTDALTAMGYSAGDAGHFADVMAAASSNANTNVGLMGSTFQYAAPLAGALGYNIEDTAVAIGLMANAGVKGDKAGTALRSMFTRLASPPKEAAKALDALGVSLTDSNGKVKPFSQTMSELREKFAGLDKTQKTQAASAIAGKNAMSGLLAIVNASDADFQKLTKAVNDSEGAAQSMADTMTDNVAGQITLLKSQIEGLMINVFEKIAPSLRKVIDGVSKALDSIDIDKVSDTLGKFADKIVNLITFALTHGRAVLTMVTAISGALATMFVTNKITTFVSGITGMITTLRTATTVTEGATLATKALALAQMALPWVAIAAGVAAVTAAFVIYKKRKMEAAAAEYKLTDEQQKQIDKTKEQTETIKELNKQRDESTAAANGEADYLTRLKDEYNGLIDKNGQVKAGYEDRANFIKSTLASALGLEQGEIDKLIGKNGELTDSIDKVIEKKRAEAVLSANEEAYKNAVANRDSAIAEYGKNLQIYDETKKKYEEISAKYKEVKDTYDAMVASGSSSASQYYAQNAEIIAQHDQASKSYKEASKALNDSKANYIDYTTTIQNYENLAAATQDGSSKKIQKALADMNNGFKTSKTATKEVLKQQVEDYKQHYYDLKAAADNGLPNVTQAEVDAAKDMVDQAEQELAKLEPAAKKDGQKAGKGYSKSLKSTGKDTKKSGQSVKGQGEKGVSGTSQYSKSGSSAGSAYAGNIGNASNKKKANSGGTSLANQGKSGMESVDTSSSGENFGLGFTNSITSGGALSRAWDAGWKFAQKAWAGLKAGQDEGSPSKLTYKSGIYFTQGYINGIISEEKALTKTVTGMVGTIIKELAKMSNYNFEQVGEAASSAFAKSVETQTDYMISKIQYKNESKISNFDKTIASLQKKQQARTDKLQAASDKKVAALQKKKDNLKKQADKNKVQREIDAEKKRVKKQIKSSEASYKTLIARQNKMKSAYQNASSAMLSEFQKAISDYQNAAQQLIDDTINGITTKYTDRYNELMNKQDSLIQKLKESEDLFEVSGAGVMTVNDLKAQTKAITDYTDKLQKIKSKVSADLFDQITSYDMTQGSAFLDRLLAMSATDLDAYNKAYTEKMQAAQKAGESIYKSDFDKVAKDYDNEINTAFKNLPAQLEALGKQSMQGFVNGLTKNTDYMSKSVKTFISGMIATFKKQLKIKSPSRVMMEIGDYTGQGYVEGLADALLEVRGVIKDAITDVSTPLNGISDNVGIARSTVGNNAVNGATTTNSTVVNNYNMVQNNNSPKSLSALDTYQARRQQIAMIKAATAVS